LPFALSGTDTLVFGLMTSFTGCYQDILYTLRWARA